VTRSKTTEEQPWGVYDIEYYDSPYETFFCVDYGEPYWARDYGLKEKRPNLYAEMQQECGNQGYALSR
jgi:hypothetical protein